MADPRIDAVRRLARAHGLLHEAHAAERAKYPARMSAAQARAFKAWERKVWWPRFKALDQRRHAAEAEARKARGYERPADPLASDALIDLRNVAKRDSALDGEVDLEALTRG